MFSHTRRTRTSCHRDGLASEVYRRTEFKSTGGSDSGGTTRVTPWGGAAACSQPHPFPAPFLGLGALPASSPLQTSTQLRPGSHPGRPDDTPSWPFRSSIYFTRPSTRGPGTSPSSQRRRDSRRTGSRQTGRSPRDRLGWWPVTASN